MGVGVARQALGEIHEVRQRLVAGLAERPGVAEHAELVGGLQAGETPEQRPHRRRRIEHAVVADQAGIDHQRSGARVLQRLHQRTCAQDGLGAGPAAGALGDHWDAPGPVLRPGGIGGEAPLGQEHAGIAGVAGHDLDLHQRHAGLLGEVSRHAVDRLAGDAVHRRPEVVPPGGAIGVAAQVGPHAVAPDVFPDVGLQHADDGPALVVGDGVADVVHLLDGLGRLDHRMGGRGGVELQRLLAS